VGKKPRSPKREQSSPLGDIAVVWGKNENGIYILRRRAEEAPVEAGVLQPLVEGKPINGEVISMQRRSDLPFVFDVKTEVAHDEPAAASQGPSQVATESYRRGWDAIWGPGARPSRSLN
jgi:hypothetical protein